MQEVKVWFPSAEPSPLPLKGKTFKQNFPKWYILFFICERFRGVYEDVYGAPNMHRWVLLQKREQSDALKCDHVY